MQVLNVEEHRQDPLALVRALEQGRILFFPTTPFTISVAHQKALLNAGQADGNFHKNISYKPKLDRISGLGKSIAGEEEEVRSALRDYSRSAVRLMEQTLAPYRAAWKLDYASFRSIEEEGRALHWKKRNDLLHTDAFPTRPTNGGLILRCFTNINPTKERVWVTGDPFTDVAGEWALKAGLARIAERSSSSLHAGKRSVLRALQGMRFPCVDRSGYDEFMLGFHDFLKSNSAYQEGTAKHRFAFPPNSTWMVFTDVVPHSVLSGQYALEQTMIIDRSSLLQPEYAPASILESLCGVKLTD